MSARTQPLLEPRRRLHAASRCLPERPGVYMMEDADGSVLYVGKAVNLRRRVVTYATPSAAKDLRISKLVSRIHSVSFVETTSELEALLIESRLIKHRLPTFNRQLAQPESCCYLMLDSLSELPRVEVVTRPADGSAYLGPFWGTSLAREAAEAVANAFKLRRCPANTRFGSRKWPCAFHEVGKCSGPCGRKVSLKDYKRAVQAAWDSLAGRSNEAARLLEMRRDKLSEELRFEEARSVQRQIRALEEIACAGALTLGDRFTVTAPSYMPFRPVVLLFAGGRLADRLVASPRAYPDADMLARRIGRLEWSSRDILPGVPSLDDMLILRSYIRRKNLIEYVLPLCPETPIPTLSRDLLCRIDALRS